MSEPHVDRMKAELGELSERLRKLGEFTRGDIFSTLPSVESALMLAQQSMMGGYQKILKMRIDIAEELPIDIPAQGEE